MLDFIKYEIQFILILLFWIFSTWFLGPAIYLVLPLTVMLLRSRGMYLEILLGFVFILIMSDMDPGYVPMRKIKSAKNLYMLAMAVSFYLDRKKFQPYSQVFYLFLPFFVYSYFPLIWSGSPMVGVQKTLSYGLLFLIVPNVVLYNFREYGWESLRDLVLFILLFLVISYFARYYSHHLVHKGNRFRGFFGNPNGLGIFLFLYFMLFSALNSIKPDLFSRTYKIVITVVVFFLLYKCESRTTLAASLLFLIFSRVFRFSPYIGLLGFVSFLAIAEYISSNLATIVVALDLEEYFRLNTLEDGSGRYFAWNFAWEKIQDYLIFGGGFGNDEYIMRQHYGYLNSQGHQGGVHNSYLTMWFNVGIVGLLIYFRSFFLVFLKGAKRVPVSYAIMFAVLFAIIYESWINGSLNPFTVMLLVTITCITEDEVIDDSMASEEEEEEEEENVEVLELT
jgi:O-antigen ligase